MNNNGKMENIKKRNYIFCFPLYTSIYLFIGLSAYGFFFIMYSVLYCNVLYCIVLHVYNTDNILYYIQ